MAKKHSRAGGKFTGSHTTLIPAASIVADVADSCSFVTRISPGFVKAGLRSVGGKRRVKITKHGGRLLLKVRDNTSHQEIHVYAADTEKAAQAIAEGAEEAGLEIAFGAETD